MSAPGRLGRNVDVSECTACIRQPRVGRLRWPSTADHSHRCGRGCDRCPSFYVRLGRADRNRSRFPGQDVAWVAPYRSRKSVKRAISTWLVLTEWELRRKLRHDRRSSAVPHRKVATMPGPFSSDRPSDRLFSLPSRHRTEGRRLPSETLKVCARLETALNELIVAETQLNEGLSHSAETDHSYALDQVRIARLQCDAAAEEVFKSRPRTDTEKMTKREVVAVYLAITDLDQLELFTMLGPNLLSQCGNDLPVPPLSSSRPRSSLWATRLKIGLTSGKSPRS